MDDTNIDTPAPRLRPRRIRRVAAAAAVGLGLTLGAAGIAAAVSPAPSPGSGTTAQAGPDGPPPDGRHHRGGPHGDHRMGLRGAIRGELVVPDGKGGWRTVQIQRGVATAVSATSLTVKSPDGVSKNYVLTKNTRIHAGRAAGATLKVGDKVAVRAALSGGTATAEEVRDLTQLEVERGDAGPPPPDQQPDGTPASPSGYDGSGDASGA